MYTKFPAPQTDHLKQNGRDFILIPIYLYTKTAHAGTITTPGEKNCPRQKQTTKGNCRRCFHSNFLLYLCRIVFFFFRRALISFVVKGRTYGEECSERDSLAVTEVAPLDRPYLTCHYQVLQTRNSRRSL